MLVCFSVMDKWIIGKFDYELVWKTTNERGERFLRKRWRAWKNENEWSMNFFVLVNDSRHLSIIIKIGMDIKSGTNFGTINKREHLFWLLIFEDRRGKFLRKKWRKEEWEYFFFIEKFDCKWGALLKYNGERYTLETINLNKREHPFH